MLFITLELLVLTYLFLYKYIFTKKCCLCKFNYFITN